jgi:hypothetical protein
LCYTETVKNVTIALDEDVARWARVRAAEQDKSLSRLLAELLRDRMMEEKNYRAAIRAYLSRPPVVLKRGGRYPAREALYDRKGLR